MIFGFKISCNMNSRNYRATSIGACSEQPNPDTVVYTFFLLVVVGGGGGGLHLFSFLRGTLATMEENPCPPPFSPSFVHPSIHPSNICGKRESSFLWNRVVCHVYTLYVTDFLFHTKNSWKILINSVVLSQRIFSLSLSFSLFDSLHTAVEKRGKYIYELQTKIGGDKGRIFKRYVEKGLSKEHKQGTYEFLVYWIGETVGVSSFASTCILSSPFRIPWK